MYELFEWRNMTDIDFLHSLEYFLNLNQVCYLSII